MDNSEERRYFESTFEACLCGVHNTMICCSHRLIQCENCKPCCDRMVTLKKHLEPIIQLKRDFGKYCHKQGGSPYPCTEVKEVNNLLVNFRKAKRNTDVFNQLLEASVGIRLTLNKKKVLAEMPAEKLHAQINKLQAQLEKQLLVPQQILSRHDEDSDLHQCNVLIAINSRDMTIIPFITQIEDVLIENPTAFTREALCSQKYRWWFGNKQHYTLNELSSILHVPICQLPPGLYEARQPLNPEYFDGVIVNYKNSQLNKVTMEADCVTHDGTHEPTLDIKYKTKQSQKVNCRKAFDLCIKPGYSVEICTEEGKIISTNKCGYHITTMYWF